MSIIDPVSADRLFGWRHAFDHPVTVGILAGIAAILIVAPIVFTALSRAGVIDEKLRCSACRCCSGRRGRWRPSRC
jgi:hypothetical protein